MTFILHYDPNIGNVYIADYSNQLIRKVTVATGIISRIAGTNSGGYNGDDIFATSAQLYFPFAVTLDSSGTFDFIIVYYPFQFLFNLFAADNVYIADEYNNRIRKVSATSSIITTIAGTGDTNFAGDGDVATNAALHRPEGVAVDEAG